MASALVAVALGGRNEYKNFRDYRTYIELEKTVAFWIIRHDLWLRVCNQHRGRDYLAVRTEMIKQEARLTDADDLTFSTWSEEADFHSRKIEEWKSQASRIAALRLDRQRRLVLPWAVSRD